MTSERAVPGTIDVGAFLGAGFGINVLVLLLVPPPEPARGWWVWLVARLALHVLPGFAVGRAVARRWVGPALALLGLAAGQAALRDLVAGPVRLAGTLERLEVRVEGKNRRTALRVLPDGGGEARPIVAVGEAARRSAALLTAAGCHDGDPIALAALVHVGTVGDVRCGGPRP